MKSILPIAFAALVLTGCFDQKAWIERFAPKDDDQFARQFLDSVRQARYDDAKRILGPGVLAQAGPDGLSQLHGILDQGEPIAVELIAVNTSFFKPWSGAPAKHESNLSYQLEFKGAWVLAAFAIESSGQDRKISGANFQPLTNSLEVINRFTLQNKSLLQFAFLGVCFAVPILVVIALAHCLFSRVRRRWLWIIFILFGFAQFQMNWTTGQMAIRPFTVSLLGASFFRGGLYAPIIFAFGIPLGAILFLLLQGWLSRRDEATAVVPHGPA
jgi:hypothetical protein